MLENEYIDKIIFLSERFELTHVQLSAMLGMSRNKCRDVINGKKEISEKDKIKIDRAIKVQKMLSKHRATENEILNQEFLIDKLKEMVITHENEHYITGIIIESMYIGLMFANNNMDDEVMRKVRAWRK